MFVEAPFISLLIFGLPFGIISIVFYFICCMDTSDPSYNEEDQTDSEGDEDGENEEQLQEDKNNQIMTEEGKI